MTPEELESIPSIGPQIVEKILVAVNSYYAQFETADTPVEIIPEDEALPEAESTAEEVATESSDESSGASVLEAESAAAASGAETAKTEHVPAANLPDEKKEFDTIENSEGVR
jgi:hypothetical protein